MDVFREEKRGTSDFISVEPFQEEFQDCGEISQPAGELVAYWSGAACAV